MPVGKVLVVVHLFFFPPKRIHLTFYLRILEHQIHTDCEIALVLTLPNDVERIFHDAPDKVPLLLRFDVGLHPGENGAFPPTRDGCIHSLSMRERG